VEPVRHRQTKGAATDMFDLRPPRHISTLRVSLLAVDPGEGPFTIPFADLHQCKPVKFTAYALASRLRASWMEARVTKVARVSARFSKSLARRRLRPNHIGIGPQTHILRHERTLGRPLKVRRVRMRPRGSCN
jgi:hypothetical protein